MNVLLHKNNMQLVVIRKNGLLVCDNSYDEEVPIIHEWVVKSDFKLCVHGRKTGKFNKVNRYEFPPPIESILLYGDVYILGYKKGSNNKFGQVNLSVETWNSFYNAMFCFENLLSSETTDEDEFDELKLVPAHKKTKHGYLKDGFVVDDDDEV
jgi:hypothetical protein